MEGQYLPLNMPLRVSVFFWNFDRRANQSKIELTGEVLQCRDPGADLSLIPALQNWDLAGYEANNLQRKFPNT